MSRRKDLLDREAAIKSRLDELERAANGREYTEAESAELTKLLAEAKDVKAGLDVEYAKLEALQGMRTAGAEFRDSARIEVREKPIFRSGGDQLMAVLAASQPSVPADVRQDAITRLTAHEEVLRQKAAEDGMTQAQPASAGFTVMPEYARGIWDRLMSQANSLVNLCDRRTVTGESVTLLANAETSRKRGFIRGAARAYWIGEGKKPDYSKIEERQMRIEPQQLAALVKVSDKLLNNANAIDLEQEVTAGAAEVINFEVGDAIFEGDGVAKPRGFIGHASCIEVAKETGQAAATLLERNIVEMYNRLHPNLRAGAVWFINNDVQPQIDLMDHPVKNVAGTENVGGFATPLYNRETNKLNNLPVIPLEFCETLGTVGDIALANLGAYLVGLRGGIEKAVSMHVFFETAHSCFRFMYAIDGQPWIASAITPFKGSTTTSAFVKLATRA